MISSLSKIAELSKAQTYIHPTSLWMAAILLQVVDGQNTGCLRTLHWRFISRGHRTCIILKCFLCRQQQIWLCFTIKHNVSSPCSVGRKYCFLTLGQSCPVYSGDPAIPDKKSLTHTSLDHRARLHWADASFTMITLGRWKGRDVST